MAKEELTVAEAGKRGGDANAAKHTREHFQALGKKGGQTTARRGAEYYREIGKRGGQVKKSDAATG